MRTEIKVIASIRPDNGECRARVRKATLNDLGTLISKAALSTSGEWVDFKSGEMWPVDCDLNVSILEQELGLYDAEGVKTR